MRRTEVRHSASPALGRPIVVVLSDMTVQQKDSLHDGLCHRGAAPVISPGLRARTRTRVATGFCLLGLLSGCIGTCPIRIRYGLNAVGLRLTSGSSSAQAI